MPQISCSSGSCTAVKHTSRRYTNKNASSCAMMPLPLKIWHLEFLILCNDELQFHLCKRSKGHKGNMVKLTCLRLMFLVQPWYIFAMDEPTATVVFKWSNWSSLYSWWLGLGSDLLSCFYYCCSFSETLVYPPWLLVGFPAFWTCGDGTHITGRKRNRTQKQLFGSY